MPILWHGLPARASRTRDVPQKESRSERSDSFEVVVPSASVKVAALRVDVGLTTDAAAYRGHGLEAHATR